MWHWWPAWHWWRAVLPAGRPVAPACSPTSRERVTRPVRAGGEASVVTGGRPGLPCTAFELSLLLDPSELIP